MENVDVAKTCFKRNLYKSSFVLLIDYPKERISDCHHIIDAIGLRNLQIQIVTNIMQIPTTFKHMEDIVRKIIMIEFFEDKCREIMWPI